jgi:tubulin-specific chaperone D
LVKRMINICKNYLTNTGKVREGTAVLLAKLLTRPDVIKAGETDLVLKSLADSYVQGRDDSSQMFFVSGILQTFTEILKSGHRSDLLSRVEKIFDPLLKSDIKNKFMAKSSNLRKYKV